MRAVTLLLLAGILLRPAAHAADTNHLDQAATFNAIEIAISSRSVSSPYHLETFEEEMQLNHVDSIRDRYNRFLELQKTGHKSYQEPIRVFIEACKRAIEYHYQLKKYRPEFGNAAGNFNNFSRSGDNIADSATLRQLGSTKAAADSYFHEEKRLHDEAMKAWNEALEKKKMADAKWQPAPPPPKPKGKDPYLEEQPNVP